MAIRPTEKMAGSNGSGLVDEILGQGDRCACRHATRECAMAILEREVDELGHQVEQLMRKLDASQPERAFGRGARNTLHPATASREHDTAVMATVPPRPAR